MGKFLRNLHLTRISLGLAAVLLLCAAGSLVYGQTPPLVYTVENSGASLPLTGTLPSMAQAPIVRQLPDPFVFRDGTRDTTWASEEQHRQEWMNAILQTEVGPKPACTGTSADNVLGVTYSCSVSASFTGSGTSYTLSITVTVTGPTSALNSTPTTKTLTTTAAIVLPTASSSCVKPANGWPIVIGMTGPTGSWPATAFNASTASPSGVTVKPTGCAATVNFSTAYAAFGAYVTSDGVHNTDGFYKLYPTLCAGSTTAGTAGACTTADGFPNGSNSGEYAAWAFALSRIVDGLEDISSQAYCTAHSGACVSNTPLPLDITHSATTGCSYAGKMALWTGALDERIALVLSQENGGGGAPSWRISHEIETQGSVENIGDTDYDWFDSTQLSYNGAGVYKMPEDHFELMALVAPRALLQTGDSAYYWLGDRSATFDSLATAVVYDNYGIGDRFGYYIDTVHSHCVVPAYQQNATQPTINRFLFGTTTGSNAPAIPQQSWLFADSLQTGAQPTYDPNFWTGWWGTGKPAFPAGEAWNWGGDVMLPLNQSITLNTGDTITTQYQLMMPGTHAAGTVTVPTAYSEVDIACTDDTSYTITVPALNSSGYETNNQVFTIPANSNSTFPSSVYSVTNPGCDNGQPGQTTGTYFFGVGLSNPGGGNPGLTGFSTTDGVQEAAQTDPLEVTFSVADSTNGQGGTLAPWTTLQHQNPYSCTPNGCPITPTITWPTPASIMSGTALSATQLNATASETEIAGLNVSGTPSAGTGLYTTVPVSGTFTYNPPAGTVLSPGVQTLTVTFTPASGTIFTSSTSASNTYEFETIATATVPITVVGTSSFTLAPSASTLSVTQGSTATDTITVTDQDGFTGAVSFTATGLPSGVTASFSPTSSTTSSVLTLTASSTATTGGPVTVTINGVSGSTMANTTIALTVNPSVTSGFTISPSASSLSVAQGSSGTDTITVTDIGGFTGSVAFTASGMPSGVAAAFNPTSSATSSVLTLTASSTATTGTFTITVTGTSGTTATTSFTLDVGTSGGGSTPVYIDAGGAASGSWAADEDFSGGAAFTYTNTVSTSLLTGTVPPQTVLQSQRYGNGASLTYTIPGYTAGTSHTVTLYFVENYVTAAGQREFNVLINGTQVLTNFDVFATAGGQFIAVRKSFTATANSSGDIVIEFSPGAVQNPFVTGIALDQPSSGGGSTVLDIDSGGAASGSWAADEDFSGGTAFTYTNAVSTSLLTVTIPPQTVLQSQRYGSFTYTIPGYTSGSSHTVTLYFVENYVTGTGQREFNVLINGTQVLTNYDVYAAAGGQFNAVEKSFTTTANSSGQIVIEFSPGAIQNPFVTGIALQ